MERAVGAAWAAGVADVPLAPGHHCSDGTRGTMTNIPDITLLMVPWTSPPHQAPMTPPPGVCHHITLDAGIPSFARPCWSQHTPHRPPLSHTHLPTTKMILWCFSFSGGEREKKKQTTINLKARSYTREKTVPSGRTERGVVGTNPNPREGRVGSTHPVILSPRQSRIEAAHARALRPHGVLADEGLS